MNDWSLPYLLARKSLKAAEKALMLEQHKDGLALLVDASKHIQRCAVAVAGKTEDVGVYE